MNSDILIVDDNIDNLKTLESFFINEGYSVRCAANGKTALMIASNLKPGIILLDIQMPDMDGFEVCSELKKNGQLKDIPILFISAETSLTEKVKAFQYGAVDYITKPFQFEETLARVQTHLSLMTLREKLENSNYELQDTINKLKDTQEQLIQSAKMASLGTLIAGITHEINNPINYIMTGIPAMENVIGKLKKAYQVCLTENEENPNCKLQNNSEIVNIEKILFMIDEILSGIRTGAERTADIVKGLKQFTKADNARTENINLNECVKIALLILHNEYKRDIKINTKYSDLPPFKGYKGKIEQVIMNIIKNSIDAIRENLVKNNIQSGIIDIETGIKDYKGNKFISAFFRDNGGGIEEKNMSKIFDPFFSTKAVGSGVGLGMSISYSIVNEHNGQILVSNIENGCSFELLLPLE